MGRINRKKYAIDHSNTIKKSNDLSMAKLNQGLTLNQMQLLAYAIFSTQQNGETTFRKYEFQEKFGINHYKTEDAFEDSDKVTALRFSTQDLKNDKFSFVNVFSLIDYELGVFTFEWNKRMLPHILELKEKYVLTDLTITSKFKSGFSWILYDYLKAHYGNWNKELSKEILMKLFSVEDRKTYQKSTSEFKRGVLNVAIDEINKHTELEVWYTEKRVGNKITGFVIHWSTGEKVNAATEKQLTLLREIHNEVDKNMFDYLSLENVRSLDQARRHIIAIKEIDNKINKGLSSEEASGIIQEAKHNYLQLENLIEKDGKERDTSFYYNWLEDVES